MDSGMMCKWVGSGQVGCAGGLRGAMMYIIYTIYLHYENK